MEKVKIVSRLKFLELIPEVPKEEIVAIRIGDQKPVKDSASKRYIDTLSLGFYDEWTYADEKDRSMAVESTRLTEQDKIIIDTFIDRHKDKNFVIHCEQGISRSSAIGYYILKRLGYTEELNDKKESYAYQPNREVYGLLIGKPYMRNTEQELLDELRELE